MKLSLMWRLVRPHSAGNIPAGCPRLGVQDVTGKLWSTSSQNPSPPRGRFVQGVPFAAGLGHGIHFDEIDNGASAIGRVPALVENVHLITGPGANGFGIATGNE